MIPKCHLSKNKSEKDIMIKYESLDNKSHIFNSTSSKKEQIKNKLNNNKF